MIFRLTLLCLAFTSIAAMAGTRREALPEPVRHQFSLEYGLLNNADPANQTTSYAGMGLRYAYVFATGLALAGESCHDELAAEAGAFYYTISGFQNPSDQITVVPAIITARYGVAFGEYFTPFVYAGVMKNFSNRDILSRIRPALGAGAFINVVRNFAVRAEIGTDLFAAGLVGQF